MMTVPVSHPLAPPQKAKHQHRGRHTAYTVSVPPDFAPTDAAEVPEQFTEVELLASNLTLQQGIAAVRHYNQQKIDAGLPDGRWAVLVFCPHCAKGGAV